MKERLKEEVLTEFRKAEKVKRHELKELFTDVYAGELPYNLVRTHCSAMQPALMPSQREQRKELGRLLRKYGDAWEPWREELKKFKDGGKSIMEIEDK